MIDLILILLLALGATAFLHYRISKWRSRNRIPAFIINLLFPMVYLPFIFKYYWILWDTLGKKVTGKFLVFGFWVAAAVVLIIIHRKLWRRRGELPVRAARYIWLSLLIPFWNFLYCIALMNEWILNLCYWIYPITPDHANFYLNYFGYVMDIPLVLSSVLGILYVAYIAYLENKLDHDFAKIREYWRRFAGKYFPSSSGDHRSGRSRDNIQAPPEGGTPDL